MKWPPEPMRRRSADTWMRVVRACGVAVALSFGFADPSAAAPSGTRHRAVLREMQIHKVSKLGLEIWVENQPEWEAEVSSAIGHPTFVARSPLNYHPPTVITYASWPNERVAADRLRSMATTAIQRASRNFGLTQPQSIAIVPSPVRYGVLQGYEAKFAGVQQGSPIDVTVFVGHQPGRFPVALSIYTLGGKMDNLTEQRRRAWTKLRYLP